MGRAVRGAALAAALAALAGACASTRPGPSALRDFGFEGSNFEAQTKEKQTLTRAEREAEIKQLKALGQSHARQTEADIQRSGR